MPPSAPGLRDAPERPAVDAGHPSTRPWIRTVRQAASRGWRSLDATPTGRIVPGSVLVFAFALVIGAIAGVVSVSAGAGIAYRDEQLHLTIARRLVDSDQPGFQQLGTVWLPLPHLILAPFVLDFSWWVSGAGAAIVGAVCLGLSASALYRIAARTGLGRTARLTAVAVFVSSPAVLYVFTTPLTEPVLLTGILGSLAGLARWSTASRPHSAGEVAVFSGLPLAVAVLSRYEGWALLLGGTLYIAIVGHRRHRSIRALILPLIGFAAPSVAAIGWWLAYNYALYGNPLEFANGPFSAAELQRGITEAGLVTTAGAPGISVYVYAWSILQAFGPLTATLGVIGAALLAFREGLSQRALLFALSAVPALFSLVSLAAGQSVIYNDHTLPTGWWNTRYALVAGLPLALATAYLAHFATRARGRLRPVAALLVVLVLLAGQSTWMLQRPERVAVLAEAADQRTSFADMRRALTWLGETYDGGRILIDESNNPFVLDLNLPLVELVDYASGDTFVRARENPGPEAAWIFLHRDESADVVAVAMEEDPTRLSDYALAHTDGPYEIWKRTD